MKKRNPELFPSRSFSFFLLRCFRRSGFSFFLLLCFRRSSSAAFPSSSSSTLSQNQKSRSLNRRSTLSQNRSLPICRLRRRRKTPLPPPDLSDGYLLPCFMDIVRVWTVQHCESGDHLNILFPLLNAKICAFFKQENCGVGYLAGAVAAETFLLNLTLKVQVDSLPRPDLQKELTIWSGNSISAFQNYVFFDIILRLLLKPPMPVITILGRYPPAGYHPSDTTCWIFFSIRLSTCWIPNVGISPSRISIFQISPSWTSTFWTSTFWVSWSIRFTPRRISGEWNVFPRNRPRKVQARQALRQVQAWKIYGQAISF